MTRHYERGLVDLGHGLHAWLQPDGGWGWSNAGLITDQAEALLVDTLFDEPLTDAMLRAIEDATGYARSGIGTVVNTHANGDHTHGNALLEDAEIIASAASAAEMAEFSPQLLAYMRATGASGAMGIAGSYFAEIFAPFDFAGVRGRAPTRTFEGRLDLRVGDLDVALIDVGPAHTRGDVLVHVPAASTVFTGDILFIDGTPIMWEGPVGNWIAACDQILAMQAATIVPGHGPLATPADVVAVRDYLIHIREATRVRFDAGLSVRDAVHDIRLDRFAHWRDAERLAVNVDTLYREFAHDHSARDVVALFGQMAELYYDRRG